MYLELLYKALDSQFGIVVSTDDVERLRAKLYAERRAVQNPAFEDLVFKPSHANPTTELWIARKHPRTESPDASS